MRGEPAQGAAGASLRPAAGSGSGKNAGVGRGGAARTGIRAVFGSGGSSYTPPHRDISLLEGIRELAPNAEILHAPGPDPNPQRGVFASSVFECSAGAGLHAEYFDNNHLEGEPLVRRVDERIDFAWGIRPPAEGITEKQFSVRWAGAIRPER